MKNTAIKNAERKMMMMEMCCCLMPMCKEQFIFHACCLCQITG